MKPWPFGANSFRVLDWLSRLIDIGSFLISRADTVDNELLLHTVISTFRYILISLNVGKI